MIHSLIYALVIFFALIGVIVVYWLLAQFVSAFREARQELYEMSQLSCSAPVICDAHPSVERAEEILRGWDAPVGEEEKELDNDQADSHI